MSTHENDEREEEVIGRALDALETLDVDDLDVDDDVLEYFEVVSHLPFDEVTPPASLEARVLDAAREARSPEVPSLASRRRRTRRIVAVGAAAAVAAAVTLVVIVDNGSNPVQTKVDLANTQVAPNYAQTLLARPGHRRFDLTTSDGNRVASVVVAQNGDAALYDVQLPPRDGESYWFFVTGNGGKQLPLGTVDDVTDRGFVVHGPFMGALITAEQGVPKSPGPVVARGSLG